MNEELQNKIDYFAAWVRLHSDSDLSRWTLQQLIDSFLLLPQPHTGFVEWLAAKQATPEKKELTDEQKIINNEQFVKALKKNKPGYLSIKEA